MAAPKTKTHEERLQRIAKVAEMYFQCMSMAEIGRKLGISAVQVYRDICFAREQWRTRYTDAIEKHKQNELGRIDHLELEAWKAWKRSIGNHVKRTVKSGNKPGEYGGPFDEETEHSEKLAGDPRFLDIVNKCIENRRKILGLDAPVMSKVELLDSESLEEKVQRRRKKLKDGKESE